MTNRFPLRLDFGSQPAFKRRVPQERRNLYRILFVQPEAPPEVIKAAYRALMTTLRGHPDLGGNNERAAQLNVAYAVLSDPAQRAAYDERLRLAHGDIVEDVPGCPFCGHRMPKKLLRDTRCAQCESPLFPAPDPGRVAGAEPLGRRRGERFERATIVRVLLRGLPEVAASLRDLSLGGLSFHFDRRLPLGTVLRVCAPAFDALVQVAACRSAPGGLIVHARLLTLLIEQGRQGVVVDARA